MPESLHAFDLFQSDYSPEASPIMVLFGDDTFLKTRALIKLRDGLAGGGDSDMSVMQFDGDTTQWKDVVDELSTISLFGSSGPRIVIVRDADPFVSSFRGEIEDYLAKPCKNSSLILTVQSWLKTTRLYKAVDKIGQSIECRAPQTKRGKNVSIDEHQVVKWVKDWAKQEHQLDIKLDAAKQVVDLIGIEFGLIDQSLAKLALFADDAGKLQQDAVKEIVGGWQAKTTWDMIDAAASGDAANAIEQLHRLLQSGQHPNALYGQISWSLRRYADAAEVFLRAKRERNGDNYDASLKKAGFQQYPAGAMATAKSNMKQLGRERLNLLYSWLVETDLELKGSHSSPHRSCYSLEKLIFRMAKTPS